MYSIYKKVIECYRQYVLGELCKIDTEALFRNFPKELIPGKFCPGRQKLITINNYIVFRDLI